MGLQGRKKHSRYPWFLTAAFIAVLTLPHSACNKEQQKSPPLLPEVNAIKVIRKDVAVSPVYVAQTQSSRLVNIQARVSGFLDKRMYVEGSIVKEGQELFQMDSKPFKVQLDQARAALAKQEAALETARLNLQRVKPLTEQNALSQKDLDDANGQYLSSAAATEQAKAQVETARLNLSYTTITSPVTGVSSSALQADGTYIGLQNSLLTSVAVLSPIWVNFSLSENDFQKYREQVSKGLLRVPRANNFVVEILLEDGAVYPHTGQITFAEPSFNPQTATFLIRTSVDNPKGILRPNQYVRARLRGAVRPNAILVPQKAVQQGSKGHFVWVVGKEDTVEQRPVKVGEWHGNDWFVFEGLTDGERVAIGNLLALRPGMKVHMKSVQN